MVQQKKVDQLQEVLKFVQTYPNFSLIRFEKTTHTALESLRKDLKKNSSKIKVVKNTILQKAFNQIAQQRKEIRDLQKKMRDMKDSSALLGLGEDWSKGLNAFHAFTDKDKTLSFKAGFLDNVLYYGDEMTKIAQLPSKDILVGKIISSMKAPMSKLIYSLKYNTNKLVYILMAKSEKTN